MEKILIIKHGALGDFVLEMGAMFDIRKKHPNAELHLLTNKAFVSMGQKMGIFADYIIDNRVSYLRVAETLRPLRAIAKGGYSTIYDLQASTRTRVKYFSVLRWMIPHSYTWVDCRLGTIRRIEKKGAFGPGKLTVEEKKLNWTPTDLSFLHGDNKELDSLPEKYVLMISGCSPTHPYKRWPVASFSALAKRLAERGISTVLIGTNAEAEEVNAIAAATPLAVSMLNKTSLMDVPDMARRALATVGNDTGPSHMAAMSGGPTIAIYDNRTRKSITRGPKSVNLVSDSTIDLITVDMVWEKLEPYLDV